MHNWPRFLLLLGIVPSVTALQSETLLNIGYQSKGIVFSDWVSLFTLCLTPLVVHVLAGTPEVVCLPSTRKLLNWHRRFCQYNPTTIIWRYFAIADRRIRAKDWSAVDMAASNALFWTTRGWDGSEEMIQRTRSHCLKFPDKPRATIFSKSFVKTAVITIQGVQAIIVLLKGFFSNNVFISNIAIDTIFFPLAVLGLLRLFAAPWLTEDYFYAELEDRSTAPALKGTPSSPGPQTIPYLLSETRTTSTMGLLDPADYAPATQFHPVNSWRGRLFRFIFLIPVTFLWVMTLLYIIPTGNGQRVMYLSPTLLLVNIFYLFFLTVTLVTYIYYFIRGPSATTVIPCIVSTWYQIYHASLIFMVLVTIIVASVETRKTTCGTYTTWPLSYTGNDEWMCGGVYANPNVTDAVFGLALRYDFTTNITMLPQGEYRITEFNGLCLGTAGPSQHVIALNSSSGAS
jgi:hypothetical protein